MRLRTGFIAIIFVSAILPAVLADAPTDVPAGHWARKDVEAILQRNIMAAPAGRFNGSANVTRTELIQAMAQFGKSLEKSAWKPATGRRGKPRFPDKPAPSSGKVTRYELAALIARMGSYAAAGIPRARPKQFGESIVLPPPASLAKVSRNDPAYPALQYLAKNRMIWPDSNLGKPGKEPVTDKDVADAIAAVIIGVVDLQTDEPQNRDEIPPPPNHGPGRPKPAGAR